MPKRVVKKPYRSLCYTRQSPVCQMVDAWHLQSFSLEVTSSVGAGAPAGPSLCPSQRSYDLQDLQEAALHPPSSSLLLPPPTATPSILHPHCPRPSSLPPARLPETWTDSRRLQDPHPMYSNLSKAPLVQPDIITCMQTHTDNLKYDIYKPSHIHSHIRDRNL